MRTVALAGTDQSRCGDGVEPRYGEVVGRDQVVLRRQCVPNGGCVRGRGSRRPAPLRAATGQNQPARHSQQGPAGELHPVILGGEEQAQPTRPGQPVPQRQPNSAEVDAVAAVSTQRVFDALEPVLTAAGYDLEDVSVSAAGRRSVVRVVVDRDGGVDLDAVADVSRAVSEVLDDSDVMGAASYVLEVSSPGVDRPLTQPRHWRRATGRLVSVTVGDAGTVRGRVRAADEAGVTLDVDGDEQRVAFDQLGQGHVQIEFAREDSTP